jgi:effector-binding domain-containing protein
MKTINRIIVTTAVIAVFVFSMYVYFGGCYTIRFYEDFAGGEKAVYMSVKGDYPKTETATEQVSEYLQNNYKLQISECYSYYYSNPYIVEKTNLNSEGGCIVPSSIDPDTTANKTFKCKLLPKEKYILCHLPYKGKLSILISSIRFYPKLYNYLVKKGYNVNSPVTELFDSASKQIIYRIKIEHNK